MADWEKRGVAASGIALALAFCVVFLIIAYWQKAERAEKLESDLDASRKEVQTAIRSWSGIAERCEGKLDACKEQSAGALRCAGKLKTSEEELKELKYGSITDSPTEAKVRQLRVYVDWLGKEVMEHEKLTQGFCKPNDTSWNASH